MLRCFVTYKPAGLKVRRSTVLWTRVTNAYEHFMTSSRTGNFHSHLDTWCCGPQRFNNTWISVALLLLAILLLYFLLLLIRWKSHKLTLKDTSSISIRSYQVHGLWCNDQSLKFYLRPDLLNLKRPPPPTVWRSLVIRHHDFALPCGLNSRQAWSEFRSHCEHQHVRAESTTRLYCAKRTN